MAPLLNLCRDTASLHCMQNLPSRTSIPPCVSLICTFFQQHTDALCSALDAAGAAEIARLLRLCAARLLSSDLLVVSCGDGDEESPQAAFIRQRCWLELHHGVYRHVAVVWRDVYLSTSLLLAAQAACKNPASALSLQRALKAIDSALLFGAILGRSVAEDVYEELSQLLAANCTSGCDFDSAKRRKTCDASAPPRVFEARLTDDELPPLSHPMPRVQPPSLLQFRSTYLQPLLPVVLESLAEHWPASTRWCDLQYLEAAAGTRTVPVELGDHYLAHNWRQQLMPVSQFIKEHILPAADENGPAAAAPPHTRATGYIAQHDLFSQVKKLRGDIVVPDYVCTTAHSDAVAGVCPAAAAPFLAHVGTHSPYHQYHCCSTSTQSHAFALSPQGASAAGDDEHRRTSPPLPPPAAIKRKVPRECVSPTPAKADVGGSDDDECSVRMHAWFGPAGCAARKSVSARC